MFFFRESELKRNFCLHYLFAKFDKTLLSASSLRSDIPDPTKLLYIQKVSRWRPAGKAGRCFFIEASRPTSQF